MNLLSPGFMPEFISRRSAFGVLAAGATVLLGGCWRPSETLRYRLTIEVETPQGVRSGSSVIEVRGVRNPDWVNIEGRGTRASFRGEAVAVDLPHGKTLFALLRSEGGTSDAADYPWLAFRERQGIPGTVYLINRCIHLEASGNSRDSILN